MATMHRSLFHFSKRSRDQLKAHVLMFHHRLPSPDPSLVSNAASTKSLAFWRISNGMVPVSPIGSKSLLQAALISIRTDLPNAERSYTSYAQTFVFAVVRQDAETQRHLGLQMSQSVMDQ